MRHTMNCMNICGAVTLLLALLMIRLRRLPDSPATTEEIEADGGKWVKTSDGRLIEYFTCGKKNGTPCEF